MSIHAADINYVYKRKSNQTKTPTGVRVAFTEDHTKKNVMKAKKRIKG